jgi:hypothetical protein
MDGQSCFTQSAAKYAKVAKQRKDFDLAFLRDFAILRELF